MNRKESKPPLLETVGDFVEWAVNEFEKIPVFYGHGTDNAWDEALYLIFPTLGLPLEESTDIERFFNRHLSEEQKQKIIHLIHLRTVERIPVAYLTHQAWFSGLPFYVDENVLIPRSPMAELIEQRFSPWLSEGKKINRILDIGTGSGCIACACAMAFPEAQVDAADISPAALTIAEKNIKALHLEERVHGVESDVFSNIKNQYDIIISNPPYVDAAEMADLPPEYLHEPRLGLASGEDGLDCVRQILKEAKNYLTPDGLLIVEVGISSYALEKAFPRLPFTWVDLERGGEGVFLLSKNDLIG